MLCACSGDESMPVICRSVVGETRRCSHFSSWPRAAFVLIPLIPAKSLLLPLFVCSKDSGLDSAVWLLLSTQLNTYNIFISKASVLCYPLLSLER